MQVTIHVSKLGGTAALPPSKSLSHRAVLAASLAKGCSVIDNIQPSEDVLASLEAIRAMGAQAELQNGTVRITGTDPFAEGDPLTVDCGESGSTLRFLIPLLALSGRTVTLTGRGRLFLRPLGPYETIFRQRGLLWQQTEDHLTLAGPLTPGDYRLRGDVSSQFITGLLLALPLLKGDSTVWIDGPLESSGYIDLTRQVQELFGVGVRYDEASGCFLIPGRQVYKASPFTVPADYSQAAFLAVLGAVRGGLTLSGLESRSAQPDAVIFEFLARCGAGVHLTPQGVELQHRPLFAGEADLSGCPDLGPILSVLGLFCHGTTRICNARRLRIKESDRIASMKAELEKFGAEVTVTEDSISVTGCPIRTPELLYGHGDHRIVMALTVAALAAGVPARISGAEAVRKSWPEFFDLLRSLGADIEETNEVSDETGQT